MATLAVPAAAADFVVAEVGDVRGAFQRLLRRLAEASRDPEPEPRLGAQAGPVPEAVRALLPTNPMPAAVLVGFVERGWDPAIVLTVRASHLRQHAGQISFPGGRIEAADADAAAAALREAQEEIGLPRGAAQVVGLLPDQLVLTGYRITPVVARIDGPFVPRLDASEVQEVFELPLSQLLDASNQQNSLRRIGGTDVTMRDIRYGPYRIWGATAGILLTLREFALER